jgi:hypothetical protein
VAEPSNPPSTDPGSRAELEAAIADRDREIVRLRDLLIARDGELGYAKGRLKIIDDHAERMNRIAVRARIPGLAWIVGAIQRALLAGGRG